MWDKRKEGGMIVDMAQIVTRMREDSFEGVGVGLGMGEGGAGPSGAFGGRYQQCRNHDNILTLQYCNI